MSEDQLAALERLCFPDAWDGPALTGLLANPAVAALGWEDGGAPVAYLIRLRVESEAEILRLGVPPAYQRRGYGGRLLEVFLEEARAEGITRLFLEVRAGNGAALAMYRRAGFRQVGKRPAYYRDPVEDALLLEWQVSGRRGG